jgi:uncharacterized iron-regulated membrane protein
MKAETIKRWYFVHKWTSLICTVFLLLLCVTGLPLIFYHEIDHTLGYTIDPPDLPEATGRASLDAIVADALARRSGDALQFVMREADEPEIWFVGLGATADAPDVSAFYTYDARTGGYLHEYPLRQGVMYLLFRLHYDLFAGLSGTLFLGAMGVLLAASLISGTVLYSPFMRKLRFGTVRHKRSARVRWLDLHNLLGIATLAWLLVVGVTGVINTLAIPILGHWQMTQLAEMTDAYRGQPVHPGGGAADRALAAAHAAEPDMELAFMAFPGNDFASPGHFIAYMRGTTPWTSKLLKPVLIEVSSGAAVDSRNLPWYVVALLVSQPLHFGDYGGLPLKVLWAVLDLLAIVVLGSGVYLWLKRRNVAFDVQYRALAGEGGDEAPPATASQPRPSA